MKKVLKTVLSNCATCTKTALGVKNTKNADVELHKTFLKIVKCLGTLLRAFAYNNTCNPPIHYSFLLHPISNKIPSPKTLTVRWWGFSLSRVYAGLRGFLALIIHLIFARTTVLFKAFTPILHQFLKKICKCTPLRGVEKRYFMCRFVKKKLRMWRLSISK